MTAKQLVLGAALAALITPAAFIPAQAIVGGTPADPALKAHVVEVVSSHGACSGVVVGRNLVLTAGHCVDQPGSYAVLVRGGASPTVIEIDGAAIHPAWTRAHYQQKKPSPDVALVRTRAPLPAQFRPIALSAAPGLPAVGTPVTLAGFGLSEEGNPRSGGVLRQVPTTVLLRYVAAQVKLAPAGRGPAGACDLDSGGAALTTENGRPVLAGIIAWSAGEGARNCGTASAITATGAIADWLPGAAKKLGGRLGE